jgi:hypothetical protein
MAFDGIAFRDAYLKVRLPGRWSGAALRLCDDPNCLCTLSHAHRLHAAQLA